MGFENFIESLWPFTSNDVNNVTADMTTTAYMGVTVNNIQNCGMEDEGGGGSVNINITSGGNVVIDGMDLSNTATSSVQCFYSAENQTDLTQSLTDTLYVMAQNNTGLLSGLFAAEGKNNINTDTLQSAVQKVQINNMQNCGVGSNDLNVSIDAKGNVAIEDFTASNNSYTYLSCVMDAGNVTALSQELAAITNDSASNTKTDPFTTLIMYVVFAVIFIGLVIGGFIVFRVADGMFKSSGGVPSVTQQLVRTTPGT